MSDPRTLDDASHSGIHKNTPARRADLKSSPKPPAATTARKSQDAATLATAQAPADLESREHPASHGWFDRTLVWASTAWGSSMLLHIVLLLVLGMWVLPEVVKPVVQELVASVVEERPDELVTEVLEVDITPSETLTVSAAATALGSNGALDVAAVEPAQVQMEVREIATELTVDVGTINVFANSGRNMIEAVPEGTSGDPLSSIEGYDEAMDRITQEILNKLAHGKVLVMWLLDQSPSMQDDIEEIAARIDRVYVELGLAATAQGDALLTSVGCYGKSFQMLTKAPTYNIDEIMEAMRSAPQDESGLEHQCPAIGEMIAGHRQFATRSKRQLMLILVTDESGEADTNHQYLEATIAEARAARCPIYTLGREAVFGYPYVHLLWIDPETKERFHIPMNRGPETPFPEQLQVDGYHRRFDAHPSGFGPYEQARMCRETGGVFFMLPTVESDIWRGDNRKYQIEAMRGYLPDLSSRPDYTAERDKFETRRVLWQVINDLNPYDPAKRDLVQVRVEFFPIDKAGFDARATENINRARRLIEYYKLAEKALERVMPQLAREPSPRWIAHLELTYAQTIAYQVRLYEYIFTLEDFMKNPKPVRNIFGPAKPTTHWEIHRRAPARLGDKHKAQMDRATELFQLVVTKHAGTPWAARAEYELRRGWGAEFVEEHHHPDRRNVKVPKQ